MKHVSEISNSTLDILCQHHAVPARVANMEYRAAIRAHIRKGSEKTFAEFKRAQAVVEDEKKQIEECAACGPR